jgi:hypothetical protein
MCAEFDRVERRGNQHKLSGAKLPNVIEAMNRECAALAT